MAPTAAWETIFCPKTPINGDGIIRDLLTNVLTPLDHSEGNSAPLSFSKNVRNFSKIYFFEKFKKFKSVFRKISKNFEKFENYFYYSLKFNCILLK
jgi:hypothetical protein